MKGLDANDNIVRDLAEAERIIVVDYDDVNNRLVSCTIFRRVKNEPRAAWIRFVAITELH